MSCDYDFEEEIQFKLYIFESIKGNNEEDTRILESLMKEIDDLQDINLDGFDVFIKINLNYLLRSYFI